jgi:phage terminase large subunit GpA-like protein
MYAVGRRSGWLVEYTPSGKRAPQGMKLWLVDTGFFKQKIHGLFKKPPGAFGPGTSHFDRETTRGYLDQVTAEHHVYRRAKKKAKGKWGWEPKSEGRTTRATSWSTSTRSPTTTTAATSPRARSSRLDSAR